MYPTSNTLNSSGYRLKTWYNTILNALVYKYTIYKALIIRDDIQSNQLIAIHSDLLMVTRIKKLRCLINHYFLIISIMITI